MDPTNKLTDINETINYLYEKFPNCFFKDGEQKPLKIGIFQDLVTALTDDTRVSNTQLRAAVRRYTTNWKYLKSIKLGVARVSLDGTLGDLIEAEHVEHAQKTLKESQDKVKAIKIAKQNESKKTILEILEILTEKFPNCFVKQGFKPLKNNILDELVEKELGLTKNQIQNGLNYYSSNWNYLKSVKEGVSRINLDGEDDGLVTLDEEKVAQKTFKDSQALVKEKNKDANPKVLKQNIKPKVAKPKNTKEKEHEPQKVAPIFKNYKMHIDSSNIEAHSKVQVKLGATPVSGLVLSVKKEEILVKLDSGLTVKVKAENIVCEA